MPVNLDVYKRQVLLSNLPSISGATGTTTATDTFNEYALRGLFYRVNYSYKDRYMLCLLYTSKETSEMIEKYKANEEKTEGFWNRLRSMFR